LSVPSAAFPQARIAIRTALQISAQFYFTLAQ
jgi:hypothetical protein